MRLELGVVDNDRFAILSGLCELGEDFGEHAYARPAHESVGECIRQLILGRRLLPLQSVILKVDCPAQYLPVINPRLASGLQKDRPQPLYLRVGQPAIPPCLRA